MRAFTFGGTARIIGRDARARHGGRRDNPTCAPLVRGRRCERTGAPWVDSADPPLGRAPAVRRRRGISPAFPGAISAGVSALSPEQSNASGATRHLGGLALVGFATVTSLAAPVDGVRLARGQRTVQQASDFGLTSSWQRLSASTTWSRASAGCPLTPRHDRRPKPAAGSAHAASGEPNDGTSPSGHLPCDRVTPFSIPTERLTMSLLSQGRRHGEGS